MKHCHPNTASFVVGGVLRQLRERRAAAVRQPGLRRGPRSLRAWRPVGLPASSWGRCPPVAGSSTFPTSAAVPLLCGTSGAAGRPWPPAPSASLFPRFPARPRRPVASTVRSFPSTARPKPTGSNESLQTTRPDHAGLPLRDVPSLAASIDPGVGPVA